MPTLLTLRLIKGSQLTFTELDNNMINLRTTADSALGLATTAVQSVNTITGTAITLTTSNINEGTNLYFTNTRVQTYLTSLYNVANGIPQLDGTTKILVAQIPNIPWTLITGTPTTLSGYGVTNTLTTTTGQLTGGGALSANLTIGLATTGVPASSYGSSTAIPTFTVDAYGRLTAASTAAVIAPAGTLTGTTLASNVVTSSLTSVGTLTGGTWTASVIAIAYGGTNAATAAAGFNNLSPITTLGDIIYGSAANTNNRLAGNITTTKMYLSQTGNGTISAAPAWAQIAAADLSNGVTGTGAVVLASSPGLLGTPTAPTATFGTNTTQIATTAFVLANAVINPMTTLGDIIYENATPAVARLAGNITTTKMYLSQTGTGTISAVPAWAQIAAVDLSNGVTGTTTIVLSNSPTLTGTPLTPTAALNTNSTQIASTAFVLANTQNVSAYRIPVRVVANANINIASPGATIDGVTLANGDRVLLPVQTTASQNGPWIFNGSAAALTRPNDYPTNGTAQAYYGVTYEVLAGTAGIGTIWYCTTTSAIIIDTNNTAWAQEVLNLSNTSGLSGILPVANGGTGSGTAAGARTNLGATTKFSQTIGNGSLTTITVTHNLNTQDITVLLRDTTSNGTVSNCTININNLNSIDLVFGSAPTTNQYRVIIVG